MSFSRRASPRTRKIFTRDANGRITGFLEPPRGARRGVQERDSECKALDKIRFCATRIAFRLVPLALFFSAQRISVMLDAARNRMTYILYGDKGFGRVQRGGGAGGNRRAL